MLVITSADGDLPTDRTDLMVFIDGLHRKSEEGETSYSEYLLNNSLANRTQNFVS